MFLVYGIELSGDVVYDVEQINTLWGVNIELYGDEVDKQFHFYGVQLALGRETLDVKAARATMLKFKRELIKVYNKNVELFKKRHGSEPDFTIAFEIVEEVVEEAEVVQLIVPKVKAASRKRKIEESAVGEELETPTKK
jgi:hypothetical protein